MSDISKSTRPALGRYEWILIGRNAALPDYKRKTNTQACGCLAQSDVLESSNLKRGEVGQGIRDRMWDFDEERMEEYREEADREIDEMRGGRDSIESESIQYMRGDSHRFGAWPSRGEPGRAVGSEKFGDKQSQFWKVVSYWRYQTVWGEMSRQKH